MFVTPANGGREEATRICPFIFRLQERQEATVAAPVRGSRQPTAKLCSGGRACARAATLGLTTENPPSPAGRTQGEPVPPRHHHGIFAMMYRL